MKWIKITMAIMIVFIVFLSCGRNSGFDAKEFKELIGERIKTKIDNKKRIEIKIKEFTKFEWDAFFIIPPYSKISALESHLKIDLKMMRNIRIENRDDIVILVFANQGRVVRFVEYPRWPGDFSKLGEVKFYSPNDAFFEVEENGGIASNEKKWLLIKKAGLL